MLEVRKIPRARKFKFGVYAKNVPITSHKTEGEALNALDENRSFYEYWSGSASVSIDNSTKQNVSIKGI